MNERTQPVFGGPVPEPALTETDRPPVTPDQLGTKLVGVEGLYANHVFPLTGAATAIGREADCGVSLAHDPTVSRLHARIVLEDTGHTLYDEGSSNGTFVNGVLVRACALVPGDIIQCGGSRFRYE
jgi:pSer/pThr/pTyr-binding forkhead associated (FHA) protein